MVIMLLYLIFFLKIKFRVGSFNVHLIYFRIFIKYVDINIDYVLFESEKSNRRIIKNFSIEIEKRDLFITN